MEEGVCGLPVGRVARRKRTLLQDEHNVGHEVVPNTKVVVYHLAQVGEESVKLRRGAHLVRHRHEAMLAVVESDQREEALEALEHGAVRPGVLVLGDGGVLGVGEELHEEEDEQVERFLVHGVQVDASDGDVLDGNEFFFHTIIIHASSVQYSTVQYSTVQ